jgi:cytochrome c oxidase cbb3-type subunit 2
VDGEAVAASMRALRRVGVPYTDADVAGAPAAVQDKTTMDALVAYVLSLGKAVNRGGAVGGEIDLATPNPLAHSAEAVARGRPLFEANGCTACHGDEAKGQEGVAPSLVDDEFLGVKGDLPDAAYHAMIKQGSDAKAALGRPGMKDGGMQAFGADLKDDDIWAIVSWLRNQKAHEGAEKPHEEAKEHAK